MVWGGGTHCLESNISQNSLLIIALPSQDSFISLCVNGILNMPPHHISRFSDTCLKNIANIFDLELIDIHHESVQQEHIDLYKATMWAKLFLPTPLIDRGIPRKIINRIGKIGKKCIRVPANAYGHTVIAVYKIKSPQHFSD